jgi:aldehyde:ferredoxin oxidoreductase
MLDAYYEFRGWDKETGKPTPEKLRELGLDEIIDEIIDKL